MANAFHTIQERSGRADHPARKPGAAPACFSPASMCESRILPVVFSLVFLLVLSAIPIIHLSPASASGYTEGREGVPQFTDVAAEVGFDGISMSNPSWCDFDRDGDIDLLLNGLRLFENCGAPDYHFNEITDEAGLTASRSYSGAWGDYDNDGWPDIFMGSGHPDHPEMLWHNNGDGTFTDLTAESGITDEYNTIGGSWGDFDGDGLLDLYIVNYEGSGSGGSGATQENQPDFLWHNNGDGTFTDISTEAGIRAEPDQSGRAVTCADYDNDGDLDIYVSNYRLCPNYLWENHGDGTFTEVGEERGCRGVERYDDTTDPLHRNPYYGHTIGSAFADFNNDGNYDIFVSNLVHKDLQRGAYCDDSNMYYSLGPEQGYSFVEMRPGNGMAYKEYNGGEDELWAGCAAADYDNDGDTDLFVTSVYSDIDYAHTYLWRNNGDDTFTDVAWLSGIRVWQSWGCAWADYDNDGDMDLLCAGRYGIDAEENPHALKLFRNELINKEEGRESVNTWLKVKVEGKGAAHGGGGGGNGNDSGLNSMGIGVRVTAITGRGAIHMREVESTTGTCSNVNSQILHFGFGEYYDAVDLEIRVGDTMKEIKDVRLDQQVTVRTDGKKISFDGEKESDDAVDLAISGDHVTLWRGAFLLVAIAMAAGVLFSFRKDAREKNMSNARRVAWAWMFIALLITAGVLMSVDLGDHPDNYDFYTPDDLPETHLERTARLGLTEVPGGESDMGGGYTREKESSERTLAIDSYNIASVTIRLNWEDEDDSPYQGGDSVVKNMGDIFAVTITTPWGSMHTSKQLNCYRHRPGVLEFTIRTDDFPEVNYGNYPDAFTSGTFTIVVECRDSGDFREFGNFANPVEDRLFDDDTDPLEDNGNYWEMQASYTVWSR